MDAVTLPRNIGEVNDDWNCMGNIRSCWRISGNLDSAMPYRNRIDNHC